MRVIRPGKLRKPQEIEVTCPNCGAVVALKPNEEAFCPTEDCGCLLAGRRPMPYPLPESPWIKRKPWYYPREIWCRVTR